MLLAAKCNAGRGLMTSGRHGDFDDILHGDGYWPIRPLKFRFLLKMQDDGRRHVENHKNRDV